MIGIVVPSLSLCSTVYWRRKQTINIYSVGISSCQKRLIRAIASAAIDCSTTRQASNPRGFVADEATIANDQAAAMPSQDCPPEPLSAVELE